MLFSGVAEVREWYDEAAACFRITVDVRNRTWGRLFGYRGSFSVEWVPVEGGRCRPTSSRCGRRHREYRAGLFRIAQRHG